jgi:hypothetical protein
MLNYRWPVRFCFLLLILAAMTAPAMAQSTTAQTAEQGGVGIVGGVSANPEHLYFGVNFMAAKVATNFWFRPGAEVGFGNSSSNVGINGEFIYLIDIRKKPWSVYFGGGPALIIATTYADAPASNNTEVGPGFNFIAGIRKARGLFSEIKVGVIDSPEFKLGIGYTF